MGMVSNFFGIQVYIYYLEHGRPHFHAFYQGFEMSVDIQTGKPIDGHFPRRASKILEEWALARQTELMECWQLAQNRQPLRKIPGADQ